MGDVVAGTVAGACALAAAQLLDMQLTGRVASDTPARVVERLTGRTLTGGARTVAGYAAQSSVALAAALAAALVGGPFATRVAVAWAVAVGGGAVIDPALGACAWPSQWTAEEWTREIALKGVCAVAVGALA